MDQWETVVKLIALGANAANALLAIVDRLRRWRR